MQSTHIFLKSILIALLFSIFFWIAESVAHMFYFSETFEYFLSHEPLDFMDAFIYHVPQYSLFIRLIFVGATLCTGAVIGLLLERDHKHTAELLRRERDYHNAVNAVNEGIFTYYIDEQKIIASRLCYALLGYSEDELDITPEGFYKLLNLEHRENIKKSFEEHVANGRSFSFNLKVKTRSGKWRWILLKGNVQETHKDGSAKTIMGTVADVSQKMAIRKQLEHYTSCLEEAEQVAHVGHWRIDYKSKTSSWSQEIYNILQLKKSNKPNNKLYKFTDIIHPDDRARIRREFFISIRGKSYFDYDYRVILADKSVKYISQRGHHVFDKNGRLDYSFGTIQDVTAASLALQALANSEKRYRALFDNVHQGIAIIDRESREIRLANNFFCEMFGYS
ncbi:MAG: PAS domain-containing protein, partial [Victivallales bacterium]|nr:PAS domain-containing protein [Victivallales bacterium]